MSWQTLVNVNLDTTDNPGMCLAFAEDVVGAPHGLPTARSAWDAAGDKHPGDWDLPDAVVAVFWSWVGDLGEGALDYGHVCIWVPGQGLFSSPKRWSDGRGSAWYGSIQEVCNWIGGSYLGWTSDLNGLQLSQWVGDSPAPAPVVESNQRVTGDAGANRREAPSSQSALLDPPLEANEIGNFVGFTRGEDPYGNGNNIWFRGISGNYFYSGAFTYSGTDGLADLDSSAEPVTPAATPGHLEEPPTILVPIEELYPDLTPAPADPTPTPEPVKETPVPITPEKESEQNTQIAAQPSADLGAIIPSAKGRKIAYAVFAGTSLVVTNTAVGFAALHAEFPAWLVVALAVIGNLATPFASIAIANASDKK